MSGKLASPQPPKDGQALPTVTDILAAANMRRLLDAYRSLAPLTIGGPSSTSLETPGTPLSTRPPPDPRILRKVAIIHGPTRQLASGEQWLTAPCQFSHYPWAMGGPVFPLPGAVPGPGPGPGLQGREERRRHHSDGIPPPSPVFSAKDKDSSRFGVLSVTGGAAQCTGLHRAAARPSTPSQHRAKMDKTQIESGLAKDSNFVRIQYFHLVFWSRQFPQIYVQNFVFTAPHLPWTF